ncbi:MAG TPA: SpoIID/LytB domain-containing protein [Acidobacteria bacterium]|nr:SpoIID/LytB domain-containing protein [Acidobacteriota bacterium]
MTRLETAPHCARRLRLARILPILLLAVVTARCVSRVAPPPPAPAPPSDHAVTLRVEVGTGVDRTVRRVSLEEYVRGSVPAEMPISTNDAVGGPLARLQAILARTYALANRGRHRSEGFDLCSSTHCQVYVPAATQGAAVARVVADAVADTRGVIITSGSGPIQALFHADCGGHTSSATAVWGGPAPDYLAGVPDAFCVTEARNHWRLALGRDHLRRMLNTDAETAVGGRLDDVSITQRDVTGRATLIEIRGHERRIVRATQFRAVITQQLGARAFRSTFFGVETSQDGFEFTGRGFGHGVGLCQTGAIVRARAGSTVEEILDHYYPGTWLERYSPTD